jgi:hypothetical protein
VRKLNTGSSSIVPLGKWGSSSALISAATRSFSETSALFSGFIVRIGGRLIKGAATPSFASLSIALSVVER